MSTHALVARVELPLQRSGQPGVLRSCSRERGAAPSSSWTSRAIFLARFPEIPLCRGVRVEWKVLMAKLHADTARRCGTADDSAWLRFIAEPHQ